MFVLTPRLLDLAEALPSSLVDRTSGIAAHAETVAVRILHIHFTSAPRHIRRLLTNDGAAFFVFLMQRVHILCENRHPGARLPLPTFRKKNLDLASRDAAERRRSAPVPFLGETQLVDVVVHRHGEILNVQNRNHAFKLIHINHSNMDADGPKQRKQLIKAANSTNQTSLLTQFRQDDSIEKYRPTGRFAVGFAVARVATTVATTGCNETRGARWWLIFFMNATLIPNALKGKTIAILGYGSQGHAQAQNLRDSGLKVIVGLDPNRPSAQQARADGMVVVAPDEAAKRADWIHVLTPDETQAQLYEQYIKPYLHPGKVSGSRTASAFISRPSSRPAMWTW